MHSVPMGIYDFAGLTTREIDSARSVEKTSFGDIAFLRKVIAHSPSWLAKPFQFVATFLAAEAYRRLQTLTDRVAKIAIFLEGAKVALAQEFAATKELPDQVLFDGLKSLRQANEKLIVEAKRTISSLRKINPDSRAAEFLEQLIEVIKKADTAAADLELVAEQAKHHYFVRRRIKELHAEIDARMASFIEDDEDADYSEKESMLKEGDTGKAGASH
ncbi:MULTISPECIES: hypothetical protein [unclassified Variovorax]|uniref:hypothetical protein n=1 Tax=unclassified Variovorax TaxID=663243 RepID=UPI000B82C2E6|nr:MULTISPECIES: hypothetical protein [unclassified Variovorax]